MRRPASVMMIGVGLMALALADAGCSLIGLAVDASRPPDTLAVNPADLALEGTVVLVTLRDGCSFTGEYRKLGELPPALYRARYAQWRANEGTRTFSLSPGDTLQIAGKDGRITVGSLHGFTASSVVLLPIPSGPRYVPQRRQEILISVETIDSLRVVTGEWIDGRLIKNGLMEGGVPTTGAILVRRSASQVWVPLDDIAGVSELTYSYSWFNAGAVADAVGLAAAAIFLAVGGHP
jgi:hypothetical protein